MIGSLFNMPFTKDRLTIASTMVTRTNRIMRGVKNFFTIHRYYILFNPLNPPSRNSPIARLAEAFGEAQVKSWDAEIFSASAGFQLLRKRTERFPERKLVGASIFKTNSNRENIDRFE